LAELPVEILRCPVTGEELRALDAEGLGRLNEQVAAGTVATRGGTPLTAALEAGLVTTGGGLVYRIEDGIADLLPDSAVVASGERRGAADVRAEKRSVQEFYDVVGWQQDEDEVFVDTARFVDTRPLVQGYLRECRLRIGRELPASGEHLLDVASGPVQFPEYVEYQGGFRTRICVDFSRLALTNAARNVGDKGVLVQGDITALPFADDSIDAVISLHTIYHVPRDEQPRAFREVHRVLKPGGVAVVAYEWGDTPWGELSATRRVLHLPRKVLGRAGRALRRQRPRIEGSAPDEPKLYFHAYDYAWFARQDWPFAAEVRVHHFFSSAFLERYIRGRVGRALLGAIRRLEDRFPRAAGRFGRYPLIVIRKPAGG
jgi:ubiquinone/menaquinone biosynthesis C-methylase UbiE/uncharacterized protein YbaR (Trm112 family)